MQVLPDPEDAKLSPLKFVTVGDGKPLPPGAFVCVDPRGYETLSRNLAEQARWAGEARWRLDYYRKVLTPTAPPSADGKQPVKAAEPKAP